MPDMRSPQFPNQDKPVDSFIVGLISIAIAIPVTVFIASCFGIANDSEAPESWLEWVGWRKLVFGLNAHRRWHYTGPRGQPNRHVKWFCRSVGAPPPETAINLWHSFVCALTGRELPWHIEAREAAEAAAAEAADKPGADAALEGDNASVTSSVREARELSRYKRAVACAGMAGVYAVWAIFTWFVFVYGMLIYRLLGDEAEQQFARSWGVSYGLNAASEWKEICIEAAKGAIVLAILERLCLTRNSHWLEEHVDYLSVQALMFKDSSLGFVAQIKTIFRHTKRLAD